MANYSVGGRAKKMKNVTQLPASLPPASYPVVTAAARGRGKGSSSKTRKITPLSYYKLLILSVLCCIERLSRRTSKPLMGIIYSS
jgi:hypothetical protein